MIVEVRHVAADGSPEVERLEAPWIAVKTWSVPGSHSGRAVVKLGPTRGEVAEAHFYSGYWKITWTAAWAGTDAR